MELFESLYHLMFNAATDALRAMERGDFVRAQHEIRLIALRLLPKSKQTL